MAELKLRNCPFCGESPTITFKDGKINKWIIQCNNPKCRIQPMTDYHRCKSVVVREWNMRDDNNHAHWIDLGGIYSCSNCGSEDGVETRFCSSCGFKMDGI